MFHAVLTSLIVLLMGGAIVVCLLMDKRDKRRMQEYEAWLKKKSHPQGKDDWAEYMHQRSLQRYESN